MIAQSVALFIAAANGLGETSTLISRADQPAMQKVSTEPVAQQRRSPLIHAAGYPCHRHPLYIRLVVVALLLRAFLSALVAQYQTRVDLEADAWSHRGPRIGIGPHGWPSLQFESRLAVHRPALYGYCKSST